MASAKNDNEWFLTCMEERNVDSIVSLPYAVSRQFQQVPAATG